MNTTIHVSSLYDCDNLSSYTGTVNVFEPLWRQTIIGCKMLDVLRDMYGFNVSYVSEGLEANLTTLEELRKVTTGQNVTFDMHLRPMSFRVEHLDELYPIHKAHSWKLGFILRRVDNMFYPNFFSKPFARPVWNCLYGMALLISIFFYLLKKWEVGIIGGWTCSYPYELLMVIGGYCQHIPPIETTLSSLRIAYLDFFLFAYVVYTYYTSNLLSHLVNDKEHGMTIHHLDTRDVECVIVDFMMLTISENIPTTATPYNLIMQKLHNLRAVPLLEGLEGVKNGTIALLSDYISLHPFLKRTFSKNEVCELTSIDVFSQISKYFFISKRFPYKEEFKIGIFRAQETGILNRWLLREYEGPMCVSAPLVQAKFLHISAPLIALLCCYLFSVLIMIIERAHYNRYRLWPYTN